MFRQFGPWEIGLVLVIILIFFGVGKLPQVGGAIGKAIRSFRKGQSGEEEPNETAASKDKKPAEKDEKPTSNH